MIYIQDDQKITIERKRFGGSGSRPRADETAARRDVLQKYCVNVYMYISTCSVNYNEVFVLVTASKLKTKTCTWSRFLAIA